MLLTVDGLTPNSSPNSSKLLRATRRRHAIGGKTFVAETERRLAARRSGIAVDPGVDLPLADGPDRAFLLDFRKNELFVRSLLAICRMPR